MNQKGKGKLDRAPKRRGRLKKGAETASHVQPVMKAKRTSRTTLQSMKGGWQGEVVKLCGVKGGKRVMGECRFLDSPGQQGNDLQSQGKNTENKPDLFHLLTKRRKGPSARVTKRTGKGGQKRPGERRGTRGRVKLSLKGEYSEDGKKNVPCSLAELYKRQKVKSFSKRGGESLRKGGVTKTSTGELDLSKQKRKREIIYR